MADPSEHLVSREDMDRYSAVLGEIQVRVRGAREYLLREPTRATIEYAALQLRFALEQIVIGSLITNRAAIEQITRALARQDVDDARKLARNANPGGYWPTPVRARSAGELESLPLDAGYLTEDRWGRVSALLHTRNPYQPALDVMQAHGELSTLQGALVKLVGNHVVLLAGGDYLVAGVVTEDEVHVAIAGRAPAPGAS